MTDGFKSHYETLLDQAPPALSRTAHLAAPGLASGMGVFAGAGVMRNIGSKAKALVGSGTILLVSDAVLDKIGMVDMVATCLKADGFDVVRFTDVQPEPVLDNVIAAEALGLAKNARLVVGLGGGSAMDVSKAVAIGLDGKVSGRRYVSDPQSRSRASRVPLILLPTTSGTGSEVSLYAVISEGKDKRSLNGPVLLPDVALLDPLLTVSMPKMVTAATGLDALTHAIETMTNKTATPLNDALALSAISMIGHTLPKAWHEPENIEARYDMLVASALAVFSMNIAGVLWSHSVSYILGMAKPTPHGIGCALALPYLVEFNEPAATQKHARIAQALGHHPQPGFKGQSTLAGSILSLMASLDMPLTLRDWGIPAQKLDQMADDTIKLYPRPQNPRLMSAQQGREYYAAMYQGL